jgi:hypothetical protein
MVARVFKFVLQDLEGHFYYDQNFFWGVKEAGLMKKVSAYFAKSGKDILLSHVIVFNVILLLIQ